MTIPSTPGSKVDIEAVLKAAPFSERLDKIRNLLQKHSLQGVLLTEEATVSWLFGGRFHINVATEAPCASVLVKRDGLEALVNNIEARRLQDEEGLAADKIHIFPWYDDNSRTEQLLKWQNEPQVAVEAVLGEDIQQCRLTLEPSQVSSAKDFGRQVAQALYETCAAVRPGLSEYEVAGMLSANCLKKGMEAIVNLVAGEERAHSYRHVLPTKAKINRYAIVSVAARKKGLVLSATRMLHFGQIPEDLQQKYSAALRVEATLLANSRVGSRLGDVLQKGIRQYAEEGYPVEWEFHHQGGVAGSLPREIRAMPQAKAELKTNMLMAWNPTICGVKVEDTALLTPFGVELLTLGDETPRRAVECGGKSLLLPDILVI